jgi:hypothetical protein
MVVKFARKIYKVVQGSSHDGVGLVAFLPLQYVPIIDIYQYPFLLLNGA